MADSIRKACVCLVLLAALGGATAAVAAESPADLQFDYAEGLYRDGLRKLAVAELEKFVKQYPKDPRTSMARFYLGECHHAAKDYKAALPVYEAAGKDAALPSRPIVMFRIGFCRFRLGDAAGSIAPLTEFLQTRLLDARQRRFLVHARYTLARAYFAVKDYERSLAAFQSVLVDPSPENSYKSYVLLPMGDCLAALGKGDEALARYREFEQYLTAVLKEMKAPERKTREEILIRVRAKVASLLLQQGKYDHALAAFGQLSDQGTLAAEVLYGRAQALFFLKRYQEALVASAAYIQRFPDGKLLTSALFIAGESCYRTSQFPQAEKYFAALLVRDAAGKHPAHETASFGSVAAAYRQGKPRAKVVADAAKAYLVKYEKTPRAADVRYFGAEAAFWLDDYATALEGYRAAPKDNAHAEEALHQTAVCLDHLKKAAEAGAAYDAYIAAFPQGVHYRNAVERAARLWGQLKQYDKAAERYGAFFDSFVKTDPKTAEEFLYRKGACEYEAQQYDAMFKTFQSYFARYRGGKHIGNVLYFLGWYHAEKQKQYERAATLYEQCAKSAGDYQYTARYQLGHAYNHLATAASAEKQDAEAAALFAKAAESFLILIRKAPDRLSGPQEYRWTGDTFLKLRRPAAAIEAYEALIALGAKADATPEQRIRQFIDGGGSPNIVYWLGKLHLEAKKADLDAAIAYFSFFDANLKEHKYHIWSKFGLAEALKAAGKHDQASLCYQRVETVAAHVLKDPEVRDGLVLRCQLQLGRMFFDDKNDEHALKYLLRVGMLAQGDEGAEALYKAAQAAHRSKDAEATLGIAQRLLREQPESAWGKRLAGELAALGLRLAEDGKTVERAPTAP